MKDPAVQLAVSVGAVAVPSALVSSVTVLSLPGKVAVTYPVRPV